MSLVSPRAADGRWTAGVLAGLLVLTPLLGWAGALGFAPAVALAGLLTVPALRVRVADRTLLLALFTALVWAVALDWLIWRAVPDAYTLGGGAIIIASGIYLIRREAPRVVVLPP